MPRLSALLTLLGKLGIVTEGLTLTGRNLGICQADAVIGQHGTEARHALFQCLTGFGYACHKRHLSSAVATDLQ
jgi:hypothetical protein